MGKPDDCAGLSILHFRWLDGERCALLPSRAIPATGCYWSKAEDGLLKVSRHRVNRLLSCAKAEVTCLRSSLNFREETLTTGIAAYLMEQIPNRASHIFFDPDPRFISRVKKQYFSNRLRRPSLEIQTVRA
jgi:hypothetical protein